MKLRNLLHTPGKSGSKTSEINVIFLSTCSIDGEQTERSLTYRINIEGDI